MKKEQFFRNCPNVENKKIHLTDVAQIQASKQITDDDLLMANSGLGSLGVDSLRNILTSLNALDRKPLHEKDLPEVYLLQTQKIHEKTLNLMSRFELLRQETCSTNDDLIHLSHLLTDALLLGNKIGIYNENIENLPALRDNEKIKKSQAYGAKKSNEKIYKIKNLVAEIVSKMKLNTRIWSAPLPDKAQAIVELLAKYRQEQLTSKTIESYLSDASGEKLKGGRPPKNKPTIEEISEWLNNSFSSKDVNKHFL